jgi:hypothetical protein
VVYVIEALLYIVNRWERAADLMMDVERR